MTPFLYEVSPVKDPGGHGVRMCVSSLGNQCVFLVWVQVELHVSGRGGRVR